MLPTTPGGHCGAPRYPETIGAEGWPSAAIAWRAHARAVATSRRRLSTALATTASSSGNSTTSGRSSNASAADTPGPRISSITLGLFGRQYLARGHRRDLAPAPFLRVAERNFLEPHPVVPGGPGDVQVPVHHRRGAEPDVPVGGASRAAPLGELRVSQALGRLAGATEIA